MLDSLIFESDNIVMKEDLNRALDRADSGIAAGIVCLLHKLAFCLHKRTERGNPAVFRAVSAHRIREMELEMIANVLQCYNCAIEYTFDQDEEEPFDRNVWVPTVREYIENNLLSCAMNITRRRLGTDVQVLIHCVQFLDDEGAFRLFADTFLLTDGEMRLDEPL